MHAAQHSRDSMSISLTCIYFGFAWFSINISFTKIYHGICHGIPLCFETSKPWLIMVNTMIYHSLLCNVMVYHVIPWYTIWYTVVYHGIPWYIFMRVIYYPLVRLQSCVCVCVCVCVYVCTRTRFIELII